MSIEWNSMRLSDWEPQKLTKTVRETVLSGGMVSCGVVSCGVVICGMVTCGVVICGMVSCSIVSCGVVICGMVTCGVVICGMVSCGVETCGIKSCQIFSYSTTIPIFWGQKLSLNIFSIIWYIYYQNKWSFSSKLAHHNTGVPPKDQITTV